MKSMLMYQLEGVRDDSTVSKIFANYCPSGIEKSAGAIFVSSESMPDCFKLIGYASLQDTSKLEKIAEMIQGENFNKKADKFDEKYNKMHQKVVNAKRATNQSTPLSMGGFMSATSISEIVSRAEKQEAAPIDPKVVKAQMKLDKYLTKNQALSEAKKYAASAQGSGVSGIISTGIDEKNQDIFKSIEDSKKPRAEFTGPALKQFKEFLDELLKVTDRVSVMHITDGNKTQNIHLRTNLKLANLQAEQLIEAKNREILVIYK